jgi:hypothetical protein
LKPALANSSQDPTSKKKPIAKRADGMAQGEDPEFHKKKKKYPE